MKPSLVSATRLLPHPLPQWVMWLVVGLFAAAVVAFAVARAVNIRAPLQRDRVTVETALHELRSGDLLLLADVGALGRVQRFVLDTPISHVGVLVMSQSQPWVLEATRSHGITLTSLWAWLGDGGKRVFYRRLHCDTPDAERRAAVDAYANRNLGRPYAFRFWVEATRVLPLALPMPFDEEGRDEARFCSELVAEVFRAVGALDAKETAAAHTVMPRDLWEEPAVGTAGVVTAPPARTRDGVRKLAWRVGAGLGPIQSLVTALSADRLKQLQRGAATTWGDKAEHA